ncbi:hypothetical protein CFC21_004815 [Triticum aestivum]|uniref:F-box domain-containing protein n=2 Tax=Triticum aestivum TaxID=4565 RepID=A0A3B5YR87_WHEAT|nr:hypothetical protein CFC21_004815 [Triticum aestivum]
MSALGEDAILDDDVVTEILLRLPCTSVLRSRAVCKVWHRITTDPSFLAAHAERRPAELLVVSREPEFEWAYQDRVDTIPLSLRANDGPAGCQRELHYPDHCDVHLLVGCCDGLLLFLLGRFPPGQCCSYFFVCNPVTRQGTWLDLMPPACRGNLRVLCGFYRHGPSGEHRFLVLANEPQSPKSLMTNMDFFPGSAAHYVFNFAAATVSSKAPRRLGPVPGNVVVNPYGSENQVPSHLYHRGKLHWTTHPQATSTGKILAFDTLSEEFRLISCPAWPTGQYSYLHDLCLMELHGRLAITTNLLCGEFMELWVLEDYDDDRSWSHRFRIQLPLPFCVRWTMGTGIPNVILVGCYMEKLAAVYHLTDKWSVEKIGFINSNTSARHFLFKESLAPHPFFDPY